MALSAIAVAAIPLVLLDSQATGGVSDWMGILVLPMIAIAIGVEVARNHYTPEGATPRAGMVWMFVVMPLGILALTIPGVLANPRYYEAESFWGAVGAGVLILLLIVVGVLCGFLVWFFIVFPLSAIISNLVAIARGEKRTLATFAMPVILLALSTLILLLTTTFDGILPNPVAGLLQLTAALLGIPLAYEVVWEPGLWIVRGVVFVVILHGVITSYLRRRNGES